MQTLRRLVGRRSARAEAGLFVVQGRVLLEDAASAGVDIREVYVREGEDAPQCVRSVPFVLDARTFDSVNDTVTPQGVLAVCAVPSHRPAEVSDRTWYVVADGVSDPGNLGTIIRSAEAAGADGVFVCGDAVDVWSPKTVRASAGAVFHVPVRLVESLGDLHALGLRIVGTTSHSGAVDMRGADFRGPVALVLGNEAHGLSPDAPVDEWVCVPHEGRAESLNVAMAAAVLAMHVGWQRSTG
ncbi:MAG: TrmH family RNA methyltransferase [Acidimicrobiales bacterium]